MKKAAGILVFCLAFMAMSCASLMDRGIFKGEGIAEGDLARLGIDNSLKIEAVDGEKVSWNNFNFWANARKPQCVKLKPGSHVFKVKYDDGMMYTPVAQTVVAYLDTGKSYTMKGKLGLSEIGRLNISIHVFDEGGKQVSLGAASLGGGDSSPISAYLKYVLNHTMKEVGNSVRLENERAVILFKPDMAYEMTDKETGAVSTGRSGFVMDIAMKEGTEYLLEADLEALSMDAFLKSDYEKAAETVWVPVKCTKTSVTYRYLKPESRAGSTETFSITVLEK
jgi:hypothetical protein